MDQELQRIQRTSAELVGSRRTLLHIQQRAAGERHGRHLESMESIQKSVFLNIRNLSFSALHR